MSFCFSLFLPKIHVKSKVHELLADFTKRENIEADSHSNWGTSVIWTNPSVVPNLESVQKKRVEVLVESERKHHLLSRADMSRGSV